MWTALVSYKTMYRDTNFKRLAFMILRGPQMSKGCSAKYHAFLINFFASEWHLNLSPADGFTVVGSFRPHTNFTKPQFSWTWELDLRPSCRQSHTYERCPLIGEDMTTIRCLSALLSCLQSMCMNLYSTPAYQQLKNHLIPHK